MDYLKDKQEYIDRYDLITIEECLDTYSRMINGINKAKSKGKFKKYSKKEFEGEANGLANFYLYFVKGERYKKKEETINEWMAKDRLLQEKQDNTPEPRGIYCLKCGGETKLTTKHLHETYGDNPHMLFMFECLKCKKRRAIYEDGREWIYEPPKCPKCNSTLIEQTKYKDEVMTTKSTCPLCSYKNTDISDFKKSHKEFEEKERKDKELLEKYRSEFCLSDKEGQEYIINVEQTRRIVDRWKEEERKQKSPVYQKARALRKLKIIELEKLLKKALEKEKYTNLCFERPELSKDVIVSFSIQESDPGRSDYDSQNQLKKLIIKTLEGTNWRLMSDGISQRLGILTGRLRGYESEDDLVEEIKHK